MTMVLQRETSFSSPTPDLSNENRDRSHKIFIPKVTIEEVVHRETSFTSPTPDTSYVDLDSSHLVFIPKVAIRKIVPEALLFLKSTSDSSDDEDLDSNYQAFPTEVTADSGYFTSRKRCRGKGLDWLGHFDATTGDYVDYVSLAAVKSEALLNNYGKISSTLFDHKYRCKSKGCKYLRKYVKIGWTYSFRSYYHGVHEHVEQMEQIELIEPIEVLEESPKLNDRQSLIQDQISVCDLQAFVPAPEVIAESGHLISKKRCRGKGLDWLGHFDATTGDYVDYVSLEAVKCEALQNNYGKISSTLLDHKYRCKSKGCKYLRKYVKRRQSSSFISYYHGVHEHVEHNEESLKSNDQRSLT